jgi:hypothetical protein
MEERRRAALDILLYEGRMGDDEKVRNAIGVFRGLRRQATIGEMYPGGRRASDYEDALAYIRAEFDRLAGIEAAAKRYIQAEADTPKEILRGLLDTHDPTVGAEQKAARQALWEAVGAGGM